MNGFGGQYLIVALRKIYIGSVGPFLFDDTDPIADADGDFPLETYKGLATDGKAFVGQAPTQPKHVLRKEDISILVGDVIGPPTGSTDNAAVRFDGITGKLIQNSLVIISDVGKITTPAGIKAVLSVFANNAAAVTGGLTVGDFYRNGANPDLVCVVH